MWRQQINPLYSDDPLVRADALSREPGASSQQQKIEVRKPQPIAKPRDIEQTYRNGSREREIRFL
jgi:hypothetical protein